MMKYWKIWVCAVVIASCNDIKDCELVSTRDFFIVEFYNSADSSIRAVTFDAVLNPEVNGSFVNPAVDSLYTALGLPLNPMDTIAEYIFQTDTQDYSLVLKYRTARYVYSLECGPSTRFHQLDTVSHSFDSVAVVGTVLDRAIDTNVEVYF